MAFSECEKLVEAILREKPMHKKFLKATLKELTEAEFVDAEQYIDYLCKEGMAIADIAKCYITLVDDTFREEMYFQKEKHYRYSCYEEVAAKVYDNPDYMNRYMIGLALSSFWWINHVKMRRFFNEKLPLNRCGVYREIGPGHGLFFLDAMKRTSFDVFEGIDVSPTSVALTKSVVQASMITKSNLAKIWVADFLSEKFLNPAEALIMGEVLEHVEHPKDFLIRAHETTTDSAFIFLTTCINAPVIDHIYNPGSLDELERLFSQTGFNILDQCTIPKQGCTLSDCVAKTLAVNVAYVLGKKSSIQASKSLRHDD